MTLISTEERIYPVKKNNRNMKFPRPKRRIHGVTAGTSDQKAQPLRALYRNHLVIRYKNYELTLPRTGAAIIGLEINDFPSLASKKCSL